MQAVFRIRRRIRTLFLLTADASNSGSEALKHAIMPEHHLYVLGRHSRATRVLFPSTFVHIIGDILQLCPSIVAGHEDFVYFVD